LADNDERFRFFLAGSTETNLPKNEITRRLRLHRIAETYVTMMNAGVFIFRDEKADIFRPGGKQNEALATIATPSFYNSREIKEIGVEGVKIRGARSVGALLKDNRIFVVYNFGEFLMKWDYKPEMRIKALLKQLLCDGCFPHQYTRDAVGGLVLGTDMEIAHKIMSGNGRGRNYFILDGNYDSFFYLTNDRNGETLLKLLCDPDLAGKLDRILAENLYPRNPGLTVENDAVTEHGEPVLFAYNFDMPRIVRFNNALRLQNKRGILICFDFQAAALRRCCRENVDFQTIDTERFERGFLT
jgi:hypothetical protein